MNDLNEKKIIANNVELVEDNVDDIPFPQANSFEIVIKTLDLVYSDVNTASLISQCIGFADREGKYYIDALRYLGLAEKSKKDGNYYLTEDGFVACANFENQRNKKLFVKVIEHRVFNKVFKKAVKINEIPSIDFICSVMKKDGIVLSDDTLKRRASTVRGWIQWMLDCNIS